MPRLSASTNIDRSNLSPVAAPVSASSGPASIVPDPSTQMSPFMHASMPSAASTYDSLSRQFYGARVPQTRILPANGGQ